MQTIQEQTTPTEATELDSLTSHSQNFSRSKKKLSRKLRTGNITERKKSEVGISKEYVTYLPIDTAKQRTSNWRIMRDGESNGKKWTLESTANETINYDDFTALLAVIYYAQQHPEKYEDKKIAGKIYTIIKVPKAVLYELCGNYHNESFFGGKRKNNVGEFDIIYGFFPRLETWTITIVDELNPTPITWHPLIGHDANNDLYAFDKDFLNNCLTHGATNLNFRLFKDIGSQQAQELYLYLRSRRQRLCEGIEVETIARWTGKPYKTAHEQRDTRQAFRSALNRLMSRGILNLNNDIGDVATEIKSVIKKDATGAKRKVYVLRAWLGDNFYNQNIENLEKLAFNGGEY